MWAALSRNEPTARKALLLCFVLLLAFFSYLVLPPDWMPEYRFATIAFPVFYLLGMLLLHQLLSRTRVARMKQTLVAGIALGILVISGPAFLARSGNFASRRTVPLEKVAGNAELYNDLADALKLARGRILLPDLGGTLLLSRLDVVDVAGLCDREFGRFYFRDAPPEVFAQHILGHIKPDLVHIHEYWAYRSGLPESKEFAATYLDLGDGDFVRRESLPPGLSDDQVRAIKARVLRTDRASTALAQLNHAMGLGR
jgi:hypothetical protein